MVNPLLAGDAQSEGQDCFPKDRSKKNSLRFFLPCFWLDPKAPKDQAPRKAAGDGDRGVFAGGGKNPKKSSPVNPFTPSDRYPKVTI